MYTWYELGCWRRDLLEVNLEKSRCVVGFETHVGNTFVEVIVFCCSSFVFLFSVIFPGLGMFFSPSVLLTCYVLWSPLHYLISNSARASSFSSYWFPWCIFLLQCFFLDQASSPVTLFPPHLNTSYPKEYQPLHPTPSLPAPRFPLDPPAAPAAVTPCLLAHCASFLSLSFKGNSPAIFPFSAHWGSFTVYSPNSSWLSACLTVTTMFTLTVLSFKSSTVTFHLWKLSGITPVVSFSFFSPASFLVPFDAPLYFFYAD